jgi:hypothetical protein
MKKLFQIDKYIIILVLLYFFYSCKGQSADVDSCKQNLKIAKENIKSYYKNNNKTSLLYAIDNANLSAQCAETRIGAIEIKLSIYMLLKEYKTGQIYLDSLKEDDFKLNYKRDYWYNYFAALEAESKSDTTERNKFYNEIIINVENYLKSKDTSSGILDKEPYYDLFYIKSKILGRNEFDNQINNLEKKYAIDSIFLESLKSTFYKTSVDSKVINN